MAGLIANCLARLVRAGRISQGAADAAQQIHDGVLGRLGEDMGPTHAEAAAALEAARVMAEQARRRKLSIARQALSSQAALDRVAAHPKGRAAGLMAEMTTDIHGRAAGANVEALSEVLGAKMMGMFRAGAEAMRSRWAGLVQDRKVAERFIDEIFGVDSGDDLARAAAKGFAEANAYGVSRAQQGGKLFTEAEDWRLPQDWNSGRVAAAGERAVTEAWITHINRGGLRVFDKNTGAPAAVTDIPNILKTAFEDISTGRRGLGRAFNPTMRVFRFAEGEAGAAAWKDLMGRFGPGRDIYGTVVAHISSMAREIAFIDQWGPQYRATFNQLQEGVTADFAHGKKPKAFMRWIESPIAAERTFKVLTGEVNQVQSEAMAGIFGGVRSGLAAAQLGSAVIPSVFGDSVTAKLAANWNGISGARVVARAVQSMIRDNPTMRADLARLNVTAFAMVDSVVGSARYLDETFGSTLASAVRGESGVGAARRFNEVMAGAAQFVIRAQGLQAWTQAMQRAFSMEMLAYVAAQQSRAFARTDKTFQRFLTSRGITAAEWDVIRAAPALDVDGARFFDIEGVADRQLGEKLLAAIVDERRYAILEASARVQQFTTQGLPRGSLMREIAGSGFAYKSFPMMMMVMHGARMFSQAEGLTRMTYFAKLMVLGMLAGAAAIQAKSLLQGKDPRPMNAPAFWGAATIQGGGLGIFGDLLYEGLTRGGGGLVGTLIGPLGGFIEQAGRVVFPTLRQDEALGSGVGRELARFVRWNMPGSNLWFTRLALDRLLWDQIQQLVDPNAAQSFRRTEENLRRDYGQQFYWAPGTTAPQRGPDLSNVVAN